MAFCLKNGDGWKESAEMLVPVTSNLLPAPDDLLHMIRCNCHGDCGTMRCTCKKHGITCSIACGNCKGLHVVNILMNYLTIVSMPSKGQLVCNI